MLSESVSQATLVQQLRSLGVIPGGVLLVHCAFSKVRPVEGGPEGLIAALRAALGREGTLVMPSMTWDNDHPFDPRSTPCPRMGVVAETFWRQPGVLRSHSPHAFAAAGPRAAEITAPHPVEIPHGHNSPPGRVYDLDGQVLLLGVDHTDNTTIHVAETMAGVRYRRKTHVCILRDGKPARFDFEEIDHCCQNFALVDGWLDEQRLQARGVAGHAQARLARSRDVVRVVMERLKQNETVFLHPPGVDEQCDEARASLPRS